MVDLEYKTIKEEFIPTSKAKEILSKIEDKNYEQKLALEHAKKFGKKTMTDLKKLIKSLEALNLRKLKPEHIVKIVDLMPKDLEDLRAILMHADIAFKDEELQQISDVVKAHGK